jgi:hypothetical protein
MRGFPALGLVLGLALTAATAARAEELVAAAQTAITHYRAAHGRAAVTPDARLMRLAAEQARAMAKAGVLEHDVDRPFQARIAGYDPGIAVENIAAGTPDFAATLELWKHSPGHDANLRRDGVTRFGIASASAPDSKYRIFWALIMAGAPPPHGLRQAGGPGLMAAAPGQEPVVRVRAERKPAAPPDLLSGLKNLLRPLWTGGSTKDK